MVRGTDLKPYYDEDGITIYHGEAMRVLESLPDHLASVVIADPPYSSGGMTRSDRNQPTAAKYQRSGVRALDDFTGDNKDQRAWMSWMAAWLFEALRVTRPSGLCFLFTDWRQLGATSDALQWGGWIWRGVVTWHKPSGRRLQNRFASDAEFVVWGSHGPMNFALDAPAGPSSVVSVDPPRGDEREHIAQKPVEVMRHLLALDRTGGVVLDPFIGTGPTMRAAKDEGRAGVGIELSELYCEIAVQRLAQGVLEFDRG
jgi:site-specific DNA-methyltransferase (adenine-specific)